jgi:hypothetical protein
MPQFEQFTGKTVLPKVGDGYETATLDLKLRGQFKPGFHVAKDIAAFANHLGGTLLIGAKELNGRIEMYQPLDEAAANDIQKAASEAVRDRCSPRPIVDFVRVRRDDGFVLAVNVWPYIGQPIGVAVKCQKDHDDFGDDAYVFPMRVGIDAIYLLPEQLPMFMLPEVRRVVILLNRIPSGAPIRFRLGTYNEGGTKKDGRMGGVDELGNAVQFNQVEGTQDSRIYPLDQVRTVVKDTYGWFISFLKYE